MKRYALFLSFFVVFALFGMVILSFSAESAAAQPGGDRTRVPGEGRTEQPPPPAPSEAPPQVPPRETRPGGTAQPPPRETRPGGTAQPPPPQVTRPAGTVQPRVTLTLPGIDPTALRTTAQAQSTQINATRQSIQMTATALNIDPTAVRATVQAIATRVAGIELTDEQIAALQALADISTVTYNAEDNTLTAVIEPSETQVNTLIDSIATYTGNDVEAISVDLVEGGIVITVEDAAAQGDLVVTTSVTTVDGELVVTVDSVMLGQFSVPVDEFSEYVDAIVAGLDLDLSYLAALQETFDVTFDAVVITEDGLVFVVTLQPID